MAIAEVQDKVEVRETPSGILFGVKVQARPDGEAVLVSDTVPVKPLTGATVIDDVAAVPAVVETVVGLAASVKSCTVKVTVVECVFDPLVPVTVTE